MQFGVGPFINPTLPTSEIESFYSINCSYGIQVPSDRPFTWSNSVTSYDGHIGFNDENFLGGPPIALKSLEKEPAGAYIDFFLDSIKLVGCMLMQFYSQVKVFVQNLS